MNRQGKGAPSKQGQPNQTRRGIDPRFTYKGWGKKDKRLKDANKTAKGEDVP